MHVADLMPTFLELGGTTYPKTLEGQELLPLMGKSWTQVLAGQAESPRTDKDYLAWEIFGNRALRQGDWKIRWEYKSIASPTGTLNVATDPSERRIWLRSA